MCRQVQAVQHVIVTSMVLGWGMGCVRRHLVRQKYALPMRGSARNRGRVQDECTSHYVPGQGEPRMARCRAQGLGCRPIHVLQLGAHGGRTAEKKLYYVGRRRGCGTRHSGRHPRRRGYRMAVVQNPQLLKRAHQISPVAGLLSGAPGTGGAEIVAVAQRVHRKGAEQHARRPAGL